MNFGFISCNIILIMKNDHIFYTALPGNYESAWQSKYPTIPIFNMDHINIKYSSKCHPWLMFDDLLIRENINMISRFDFNLPSLYITFWWVSFQRSWTPSQFFSELPPSHMSHLFLLLFDGTHFNKMSVWWVFEVLFLFLVNFGYYIAIGLWWIF